MKKIVFLTGTRADFGKIKSLIDITKKSFQVNIFVTGMHLQREYGYTVDEIMKYNYKNIYKFINTTSEKTMDLTLSKTIEGFSDYCNQVQPDLIVIHGDRVEALAGAIVGSLNNILVAHIEGGEISGTIDELIRHSVSKLSHTHFVSNEEAQNRLKQMGEPSESIYLIGSPDIDLMFSNNLKPLNFVLNYYEVFFKKYAILLFHPVTTDHKNFSEYSKNLVQAIIDSELNYVVIFPNNDLGSNEIIKSYKRFDEIDNVKVFPSIRFEYFLVMLKNAEFIIGNSSAGIREAPYYGVPTINIGNRQQNRSNDTDIINCSYDYNKISKSIKDISEHKKIIKAKKPFGNGKSNVLFKEILETPSFWQTSKQKTFKEFEN